MDGSRFLHNTVDIIEVIKSPTASVIWSICHLMHYKVVLSIIQQITLVDLYSKINGVKNKVQYLQ